MTEDIKEIKITRDELYEKVWNVPLLRLAKQYRLSDVGLAKICRKLKVPRPARGYWAKIEYGKSVRRPPLPKMRNGEPSDYTHYPYPKPEAIPMVTPGLSEEIAPEKQVKVHDTLRSTHTLVSETRSALKSRTPDKYGMICHTQEGCFSVRISRGSLKRALRILDALTRAFKSQGFLVSVKSGQKNETHLEISGERITFSLIEDARQIDHVLTEEEKRRKQEGSVWYLPRWDFVPTRKLSLIIEEYGAQGARRKWSDAKRETLEEKLGDFVKGTKLIAYALKQKRAKWEEESKKREEEQKRKEEEEERRRIEEARLRDLEEQAAQWMKSRQLRAYIRAVEKEVERKKLPEDTQRRIEQWLSWAKGHADRLDPIKELRHS